MCSSQKGDSIGVDKGGRDTGHLESERAGIGRQDGQAGIGRQDGQAGIGRQDG
jgi:hypothetical protein